MNVARLSRCLLVCPSVCVSVPSSIGVRGEMCSELEFLWVSQIKFCSSEKTRSNIMLVSFTAVEDWDWTVVIKCPTTYWLLSVTHISVTSIRSFRKNRFCEVTIKTNLYSQTFWDSESLFLRRTRRNPWDVELIWIFSIFWNQDWSVFGVFLKLTYIFVRLIITKWDTNLSGDRVLPGDTHTCCVDCVD